MTHISQPVLDGLTELVNIGVGRSAGSLNTLTGHHVTLQVPDIKVLPIHELITEIPQPEQPYTAINQDYSGAFEGTAVLMFPLKSAEGLFRLITGEPAKTADNEELWRMTLTEVANIIVNSIMGSITNIIEKKITFHIPEYHEDSLNHILGHMQFRQSESIVVVHAVFQVREKDISGDIVILLTEKAVETIASYITDKMG